MENIIIIIIAGLTAFSICRYLDYKLSEIGIKLSVDAYFIVIVPVLVLYIILLYLIIPII